jgi:hypothetical protein
MQPDIENVEVADWIAGGAALLLFIALFLPWTHIKASAGGFSASANAGSSFGWISIISVLAVETVLILTFIDFELPFPSGLVYLGAGALATLLSLLVMLTRPGVGTVTFVGISKIPWYGSWIGLIASVGILVGGFLKWNEQRY